MGKLPIALQLYSLREAAADNFVGVLEAVAELGYEGVEFAGYGGLSAAYLRDVLQRLGLKPVSSHIGFNELKENFQSVVNYNKEIGNNTVVCPAVPQDFEHSALSWQSFAQQMTELGRRYADEGFRLGYHNHSFEFQKFADEYGLDIFFQTVDSKYVFAQLDLGWVMHGGVDPATYLKKYAGRCPLVHVKDFDANNCQVDVGCGELKLPDVVQVASEVGVEWLIIETEEYKISPLESVRIGLKNLSNI